MKTKIYFLFLTVLLAGCADSDDSPSGSTQTEVPQNAGAIILDDFEAEEVKIVQPDAEVDHAKYLWGVYPNGDLSGNTKDIGTAKISSEYAVTGDQSLRVNITEGNIYLHFYPYTQQSGWGYANEYIQEGQEWVTNGYNRLRFWIRLPQGYEFSSQEGSASMVVGTYVRSKDASGSDSESNGGHYYHYYNLAYAGGSWHQIIVDNHPTHRRSDPGSKEHGVIEYPLGEDDYNYMNALARFYIEASGSHSLQLPVDYYLDGFEFYNEPNDENVEQIYSLSGVYNKIEDQFVISWSRDKTEGTLNYEVRYSFEDIHENGWESAVEAPNGTVSPPNGWDYNTMTYMSSEIETGENSQIYFAIKPVNSDRFRQIVIPVDKL